MSESSRAAESSVEDGPGLRDKPAKQQLYTSNFNDSYSHLRATSHNIGGWEALQSYPDFHSRHSSDTNGIDRASMPGVGFDLTGNTVHDTPPSVYTAQPDYNVDSAFSIEKQSTASLLPDRQSAPRHCSAPSQTSSQRYEPFLGRFMNPEHAKAYRRNKMRFGRMPWRDPEKDPTIAETENNRDFHVERIYNAMICGDFARDNTNSTALKRWVYGAHYQSDLVEAYAHKVFDCLLEQVKKGFRGWHQNDYVNDERKGDDDDRDIDCAGRLNNIIIALQQEKSICENVMSSAWQIRMFVNAPKAYAKRKDQNRVGNSKRPNMRTSEGAECEPHPMKKPRREATMRSKPIQDGSATLTSRPPVRMTLQRQYEQPIYPVGNSSPDTNEASKLLPMGSSPDQGGSSFGHQADAILPPPTFLPPVLHPSTCHTFQHGLLMPSIQQQRASSSPKPYENFLELSTSDIALPTTIAQNAVSWPDEHHFGFLPGTSLQLGLTTTAISGELQQDIQATPPCNTIDYSNIFGSHEEGQIRVSDVELASLNGMNHGLQNDFLDGVWNLQENNALQTTETIHQQSTFDLAFL